MFLLIKAYGTICNNDTNSMIFCTFRSESCRKYEYRRNFPDNRRNRFRGRSRILQAKGKLSAHTSTISISYLNCD